mmetsp:Transcript_100130/g.278620  ORF Transcript_100130/g.278620 Transcript_100130/m.278620 type:complete len:288 (+) Transcript_100130:82-945(+)
MAAPPSWPRAASLATGASLLAAGASAAFSQTASSCSLVLEPGLADEADPAQWDAEVVISRGFALTSEFAELPAEELEGINSAAGSGDARCQPSTYLSLPVGDVYAHDAFRIDGASRVFDLGAGFGRPLLRAVLAHGARSGVGVELSETRWRSSCVALRHMDFLLSQPMSRPGRDRPSVVELRWGDALEADLTGATHVVLFATCMPSGVVQRLQSKLVDELLVGARVFCVGDRGHWRSELPEPGAAASIPRKVLRQATPANGEEDDISHMVWGVALEFPASAAVGAEL